jgi:hypothetical protein
VQSRNKSVISMPIPSHPPLFLASAASRCLGASPWRGPARYPAEEGELALWGINSYFHPNLLIF